MTTPTRTPTTTGRRVRSARVPEGRCRVRLSSPIPGLAQGGVVAEVRSADGSPSEGGSGGVGGGGGGGALALIDLTGDIDAMLSRAGIKPVKVGAVALRNLMNEDEGLVARWSTHAATLMPHGSPIVVQRLLRRLSEVCEAVNQSPSVEAEIDGPPTRACWSERYPAATSLLEARLLYALSKVESPLAIDVLLNQPTIWRRALGRTERPDEEVERSLTLPAEEDRHRRLARLLRAPTIAAAGWANIGKSSLLNALSGREVSLVADVAGTTRDHVGAALVLDGLMVRWLDLPGLVEGSAAEDRLALQAEAMALSAAKHADLVLSCASASSDPHAPSTAPPDPSRLGVDASRVLRVALRCDLGHANFAHDLSVSVRDLTGVRALAHACRAWLVSDDDLHWASTIGPWRFWEVADASGETR
ncbi:MAG: 50S ribosome-binding GTPase [Phycisphaerales bacterium]|nr:50S ribosome-binding GTPase [Phycisphaerales bacterium]